MVLAPSTRTVRYTVVDSPIDALLLVGDGDALTGLFMTPHRGRHGVEAGWVRDDHAFRAVATQLAEYFSGERQSFDLPLRLEGTEFQRRVWSALCDIPYGRTISYGEQALRIGDPGGARAVGAANGQNPISIIVPCHRVVGADGSLTGYGGGLERKRHLLDLEAGRSRLL
jgi:methylated-DNA-[protein]-cysteine S-methyltransferase